MSLQEKVRNIVFYFIKKEYKAYLNKNSLKYIEQHKISNVVDDFCDNNSVGEIILYKDYPVMIQSPSDLFNFQLPNFGPAYIEFDYLTEVELVFSFSSITSVDVQFDNVYSVNPKDEWNRIYVNLDDYLLLNDVNTSQLVIGAILPLLDENGDSTLIGKAYIDNLRVISY